MNYELINTSQLFNQYSSLEQVLINRGIKPEDLDRFRFPTEKEIWSPELLKNMRKGAEMLVKHIRDNDPIFLQVD